MIWDLEEHIVEMVFEKMTIPNLYFMEDRLVIYHFIVNFQNSMRKLLQETSSNIPIIRTTQYWKTLYLKLYDCTI
jgi:hypothetical protein